MTVVLTRQPLQLGKPHLKFFFLFNHLPVVHHFVLISSIVQMAAHGTGSEEAGV